MDATLVFFAFVGLAVSSPLQEKVRITSEDVTLPELKREFPDGGPAEMLRKRAYVMNLMRARNVDVNAPVYDVRGQEQNVAKLENVALYHDLKHQAVVSVKTDGHERSLEGSFSDGKYRYEIAPSAEDKRENKFTRLLNELERELGKDGNTDGDMHLITKRTSPATDRKVERILKTLNKKRVKRSKKKTTKRALPNYEEIIKVNAFHVEMWFWVDFKAWNYFLKKGGQNRDEAIKQMKYHFSHMVAGMDIAFKNIESKYGYSLSLWLNKYIVIEKAEDDILTNGDANFNGNNVWSEKVLDRMKTFRAQKKIPGMSWSNPDHFMLWTGHDINGRDGNTANPNVLGVAPMGGICYDTIGNSIQEVHGFHDWSTSAHELAHNLGADHDGSNGCSANTQHLMTPMSSLYSAATIQNAARFSPCTEKQLKDTILGGTNNKFPRICLFDQVCRHGKPLVDVDKLPGQLFDADKQCQTYSNAIALCPWYEDFNLLKYQQGDYWKQFYNRGNMCRSLQCKTGSRSCRGAGTMAAEGTSCGSNKWCRFGVCVGTDKQKPASPVENPSCQSTDWKKTYLKNCDSDYFGNCKDIVAYEKAQCFWREDIKLGCCKTCGNVGFVLPEDSSDVSSFRKRSLVQELRDLLGMRGNKPNAPEAPEKPDPESVPN